MNRRPLERKAQGLSVNMIILVAIGLIILVIAVLLVNRSGRSISENATTSCVSKGGTCKAQCDTFSGNEVMISEANEQCRQTNAQTPVCCRYNFGGERP